MAKLSKMKISAIANKIAEDIKLNIEKEIRNYYLKKNFKFGLMSSRRQISIKFILKLKKLLKNSIKNLRILNVKVLMEVFMILNVKYLKIQKMYLEKYLHMSQKLNPQSLILVLL